MEYEELLAKLQAINQEHLLKNWDKLTALQKEKLASQIAALDTPILKKQKELIAENLENMPLTASEIEPFLDFFQSGNCEDEILGKGLIADGKVGCLLVAGGQGTRLQFDGPKGMFPISVVKSKSLFQIFAEKTLAAGHQAKRRLPLAIMTSKLNHQTTLCFFQENHFFGLSPEQVSFFSQDHLPFLDQNKQLFLEEIDTIANGPDGNGRSLEHFIRSGIWQKWRDQGVRYLNYVLIDNALADPFDAELVGFHDRQGLDVTIKCTRRRSAEEKVGLLVKKEGHVSVIEYTELPEKERLAVDAEGDFKHRCANLSLFCFHMDFIGHFLKEQELPLHAVLKSAKFLTPEGISRQSEQPIAWKFERYIFDVLPFSNKVKALLYPRERCFAPLKNFSGDAGVAHVKQALQEYDRHVFAKMSGHLPTEEPFELTQDFHYPTPELIEKWRKEE